MKSRSPHRHSRGPANAFDGIQDSTGEQFGSPVERVLDRLERVRRSGRGWTARCPAHDDRWPSLSIAEGHDGRVLLHDHAGCTVEKITRALGLELRDLFPPRDEPARARRPWPKSKPLSRNTVRIFAQRQQFPLEWAVACELAKLPPALMRQDVLDNWDFLTRIMDLDVPFVLHTASVVRGVATYLHCDRRHAQPEDVSASVRRLLRHVYDEGRAA